MTFPSTMRTGFSRSPHRLVVLIITPWYGGPDGGVQASVESLAGALIRCGVGTVALSLDRQSEKRFEYGRYSELVVRTWRNDAGPPHAGVKRRLHYYRHSLKTGLLLTYLVARFGIRIAHFQYNVPAFRVIRAWLRLLRIPFVITFRGSDVHQVPFGSAAASEIDRLVSIARLVTTPSAGLRRELVKRSPRALHTAEVIPNGIPLDVWERCDRRVGELERDIDVLFVGSLRPVKGPDFLIEAFAILARLRPSTSLVLVGSGEMADQLRLQAQQAGIADRIRFAGRVERADIPDYYLRARVLAVPSRAEGFSTAAAEAQLLGVPVVATSVGGLPETVSDGRTGRLVSFGDADGFATACHDLLSDYEGWRQTSDRARDWARDRFDPYVAASRFAELYERLLLSPRR